MSVHVYLNSPRIGIVYRLAINLELSRAYQFQFLFTTIEGYIAMRVISQILSSFTMVCLAIYHVEVEYWNTS
jgi:hypothetical protein